MIELHGVRSGYGHGKNQKEILHGIDLTIGDGQVFTVIGQNGCGKSTLLKTLLGFIPAFEGSIFLNGIDVRRASPRTVARNAAYLAQLHHAGDISVERLVLHGRFPYLSYPRKYKKEDFEIAGKAIDRMGLSAWRDAPMAELSGGMQQKAYIAMALAQQAPVIVMDEPTAFLDIDHQLRFAETARQLADSGKTLVLVLHDLLLALSVSDRIAVLQEGRVAACASPQEILAGDVLPACCGVEVRSIETENGTQYYYERKRRNGL